MVHFMFSRSDETGKRCRSFLKWVDEERLLTLAMVADATQELLTLLRFFDTESYDAAEIPAVINNFQQRVRVLFVEGRCVNAGYTQHALKIMKKSRVITLYDGIKCFGSPNGVDADLIQRCLVRMQGWVAMSIQTIESELPEFDVLHLFRVFELRQDEVVDVHGGTAFSRLAKAFNVDVHELRAQYED
eukprot:500939-Pyramimonas_sp.AAC.1